MLTVGYLHQTSIEISCKYNSPKANEIDGILVSNLEGC